MRREKLEELKKQFEELKVVEMQKQRYREKTFLTSELYECRLKCGRVIFREKLLKGKKEGSAAIIFALTKQGDVLLNVEPRVFTKETVALGFPAGYIEDKEDALMGAKRELLEEHGYEAEEMVLLDSFYQDEGCSAAYNQIFFASGCQRVASQKLDKDEIIYPFLVSLEEVFELNRLGYFKGANSKLAIVKAKEYIKRRKSCVK